MRKVAIINQKGGSGKTTTSVNLAAALAERKRRVLLLDLDPQASSTSWFGLSQQSKALMSVFTENMNIRDAIEPTSVPHLSIIPSSAWLINLEKVLAQEVGAETILREKLKQITHEWDYLFIDCPPTLGILTVNALTAVDEVIVPVEARIMAVNGLVSLLQTIDIIKTRLNNNLKITGILPCRVDIRTKHSKEIVDELKRTFKDLVFATHIRENIKLAEAPSFNKPIVEYDSDCRGSLDYRDLAQEIIKQEKKQSSDRLQSKTKSVEL